MSILRLRLSSLCDESEGWCTDGACNDECPGDRVNDGIDYANFMTVPY